MNKTGLVLAAPASKKLKFMNAPVSAAKPGVGAEGGSTTAPKSGTFAAAVAGARSGAS